MKIDKLGLRKLVNDYGIDKIPYDILTEVDAEAFKSLTEDEKSKLIEHIIDFWYKQDFPYDTVSDSEIESTYRLLSKYNASELWTGDNRKEIGQNITGLDVCNSFHPARWEVQCRNFKTPMMVWKDRTMFKKALLKIINFDFGNPMNPVTVRSILRVYSGVSIPSNFRPTAAMAVYSKYSPLGGKVLDPSMGWGGRLLGACCSPYVAEYHCCDPSTEAVRNNKRMLATLEKIANRNSKLSIFMDEGEKKSSLPKVVINQIPFEDYKYQAGYFDCVFTSPPYFNVEKYADEPTQSFKKFDSYDRWLNGFLKEVVKISHNVLKKGGYLLLNIDGSVKKNNMGDDCKRVGEEIFGKIHDINYLHLSKQWGTKQEGKEQHNNKSDHKRERIFIFKK
jgi:hypothetical protein